MKEKTFRLLLSMTLLFLIAFPAAAEELTVTYMTGYATLLTGGDEIPLEIGSALSDSARISIDEGGVVEIAGGTRNLTLTGPGTFSLPAVLGQNARREQLPVASLLRSRLSRLISNDEVSKPSSVMGVRGAAADEGELTWMTGESDASIELGRSYLSEGELKLAAEEFDAGRRTARDYGEFEAEMELTFLLSYTEALQGENGRALAALAEIVPDPYADWYPEYRLHHAQLLLDAGAPGRAAALLTAQESVRPLEPEGRLLLGIALMEDGRRGEGNRILKELASGSDEAAAIAREYLHG